MEASGAGVGEDSSSDVSDAAVLGYDNVIFPFLALAFGIGFSVILAIAEKCALQCISACTE